MPVFDDGQKISASLAWDRMIQSVPASYVVWKDGSTYRAECLLKDGTDYSGTDAATVIQAAIDASDRQLIFLKSGVYELSSALTIDKPLTLMGEAITPFGGSDELKGTVLKVASASTNAINVTASLVTLENTKIVGPDTQSGGYLTSFTSGTGIYASSTAFGLVLRRVYVWCFGGEYGVHIDGAECVTLEQVHSRTCDIGLYTGSTVTENLELFNVWLTHCKTGGGYLKSLQGLVARNLVVGSNKGYGIELSCSWSDLGPLWFESNNGDSLADTDDLNSGSGLEMTSIHDIVLSGTDTTHGLDLYGKNDGGVSVWNIDNSAGSDVVLRSNLVHAEVGYISGTITVDGLAASKIFWKHRSYVASGTATISSGTSSVQVAHGLAGTPTLVVLGATHSEVADAVWSADATNITITVPNNVTADRNISWYAEYHP